MSDPMPMSAELATVAQHTARIDTRLFWVQALLFVLVLLELYRLFR